MGNVIKLPVIDDTYQDTRFTNLNYVRGQGVHTAILEQVLPFVQYLRKHTGERVQFGPLVSKSGDIGEKLSQTILDKDNNNLGTLSMFQYTKDVDVIVNVTFEGNLPWYNDGKTITVHVYRDPIALKTPDPSFETERDTSKFITPKHPFIRSDYNSGIRLTNNELSAGNPTQINERPFRTDIFPKQPYSSNLREDIVAETGGIAPFRIPTSTLTAEDLFSDIGPAPIPEPQTNLLLSSLIIKIRTSPNKFGDIPSED